MSTSSRADPTYPDMTLLTYRQTYPFVVEENIKIQSVVNYIMWN